MHKSAVTRWVKSAEDHLKSIGRRRPEAQSVVVDATLPDKPTDGCIYDALVTNITAFGAFVQIIGLSSKVEGFVHSSHIQNDRVQSVGDVLTRGQSVKIKLLKAEGTTYELSMKEVDQQTGEDLCSMEAAASGTNSMPLGARGALTLGNDGLLEMEARNPDRPTLNSNAVQQTTQATTKLSSPEW